MSMNNTINLNMYKKRRKRAKLQKQIHRYAKEVYSAIKVDKILNMDINGVKCEVKLIKVMTREMAINWYKSLLDKGLYLKSFSPFKLTLQNKYDETDVIIITSKEKLHLRDFEMSS